jgi:hypothetical protein
MEDAMIDTGLIVEALRRRGHAVGHAIPVPENAGEWELEVDGVMISLAEARALIEADNAGVEEIPAEAVLDEQKRVEA